MKAKKIYAFKDIEMNMWTEPIILRNDVEAKKLFTHLLKQDYFNGCPVEMYCLGDYNPEAEFPIIFVGPLKPSRVFLQDTVDDTEETNE